MHRLPVFGSRRLGVTWMQLIAFNLFIPWIVVGRLEPDDSWQPQRWPLCPAGRISGGQLRLDID